jgi:hypothetical protein
MKAILFSLLICVSVPNASQATLTGQNPASQNAEIEESLRLAQAVVKLFNEGKYDEAYPLAKRALELREKALNKNDERTLNAMRNLAEVQWRRGKYQEARRLFERLLRGYESILPSDNIRLTDIWDRVALVYFAFGEIEVAERLYKQSLAIREKTLGQDHPEAAQALFHLAELYQFQEDYKKAEPLYKRLLDIRVRTSAGSEALAEVTDRYACLLRKAKRNEEADRMEWGSSILATPESPDDQFVSGGILNGKAVTLVQPPYPLEARATRASGKVAVRIVINETGSVIRACAIAGRNVFWKVSESAAARSKFTPTTVNGKPVKVSGTIIYNYVAQ